MPFIAVKRICWTTEQETRTIEHFCLSNARYFQYALIWYDMICYIHLFPMLNILQERYAVSPCCTVKFAGTCWSNWGASPAGEKISKVYLLIMAANMQVQFQDIRFFYLDFTIKLHFFLRQILPCNLFKFNFYLYLLVFQPLQPLNIFSNVFTRIQIYFFPK